MLLWGFFVFLLRRAQGRREVERSKKFNEQSEGKGMYISSSPALLHQRGAPVEASTCLINCINQERFAFACTTYQMLMVELYW